MALAFASGSCRLLAIISRGFDTIEPIHSMYMCGHLEDGINFLGKLHNTKQHIQFLKFLRKEISLPSSILPFIFVNYSNKCARNTTPEILTEKLDRLRSQLDKCSLFFFEICSMKIYQKEGYYVQSELCDAPFVLQSEEELISDLHAICSMIPKSKTIVFQCHFRPQIISEKKDAVENREVIYYAIKAVESAYQNVLLYDPSILLSKHPEYFDGQDHYYGNYSKDIFNDLMSTIKIKQEEKKTLDLKKEEDRQQVMSTPKTIFCDIDGTLLPHTGDIINNLMNQLPLENVRDTLKQWDRMNHTIILTTGRKESTRKATEKKLLEAGIHYHQLVMNLPNGPRVLINDKKEKGLENTAYAINLVRNEGFNNVDVDSKYITIPDRYIFTRVEKPWGYEELVECNDKYVVKKLFMKKGHKCSLQYHKLKRETIMVLTGELLISIGKDTESLETKVYGPGETVTILPYTVHRMEAQEDCLYSETSTNELWDVVRLQDSYGRVSDTAK